MKEIVIVGAGGFGRELLQWIKDINAAENKWEIKGFIDDNPAALEGYECSLKVIGSIKEWIPRNTEVFACAIAHPRTKEKIVKYLKDKGAVFTSVVHPQAVIGEYNSIGEGLVMYPHARITVNARIGNFVTLLPSAVGHDSQIGDYSTVSSHCGINGGVKLGQRVFLASHTVIIPGKTVGDDVYIGAGSVVISNIKPNMKVMGNPARKIDF